MFLVDSTKFIDWQRAGLDPRVLLADHVVRGTVITCGIIRIEVIRGLRDPNWRHDFEQFFNLIPEIPTSEEVWKQAADLAWQLDRQGKVLPLTDIVIGTCALMRDTTVVTTDSHFEEIPNLPCLNNLPP